MRHRSTRRRQRCGRVDQPALLRVTPGARVRRGSLQFRRLLFLSVLSIIVLAATAQRALADHIFGVFSGPANTSITVKQRGTQVNGSMTYQGRQLKITGWTDGGDYVRGQLVGNGFSGSFEMLFNNGNPPTIDFIMYQGQFGEFLDQGQFVRTRAIPHRHEPRRGVPARPEPPRKQNQEKKTPAPKQTPKTKPQRPALPYDTPQNKATDKPQRKLPYQ